MSVLNTTSAVVKSVMRLPRRVFGTRNDRLLKTYTRQVDPIGELETAVRGDFDQRFGPRLSDERLEDLPEEERAAARQRICVELSDDLRERTAGLRERVQTHSQPLEQWWRALEPSQRVEEYYRQEYRKRNIKLIETLDRQGVPAEAFALLREASRRAREHRHFDCQLIGGRVLFEGVIAEMRTGEGKTIVCHLAAFFNVLCDRKVHIITVNDYLVRRDAEFARPIFELLDISVGHIQALVDSSGREGIRKRAYACDITYGTNSEFGFDYLRDNMKTRLEDQVQGRLDFVIVDEVDSILIDEARTPLIISGPTDDDVSRYARANKVAAELVRRQNSWDQKVKATVAKFDGDDHNIQKLLDAMRILGYREPKSKKAKVRDAEPGTSESSTDNEPEVQAPLGPDFLTDDQVEAIQYYEQSHLQLPPSEQYRRYFIVQTERKQAGITHDGVTIAQELLDIGSLYSGANMEWPHLIENSLRAHKVYQRDRDYVVQDGQVIIVDPFTGRLMHGRQWSDGLHQSVEARENVRVKEETQTLATITIQNFIKLYRLKAGMTGTAMTEANEFDKIYHLEVIAIPTNRPVNRVAHNDKMYRTVEQKYVAIVEEIHEVHRRGRPADPFLIYDILKNLKPILRGLNQDTSKLEEALRQADRTDYDEAAVTRLLCEAYDEAMGDLVRGRPILVGTTSVENSEKLSKLLEQRYGIEHEVLNAKNHAREADIVAKAGYCTAPTHGRDKTPVGNVTIATNMAGRGTDIKLGPDVVYHKCKVPDQPADEAKASVLYPVGVTKCCIHCNEYDPVTNCAHCFKPKIDPRFPALGRNVCSINAPCGLHIIGTERHEARRIDNQLRGRSGRQGDPGSSRFSLSLEDDLLKLFMPDWMLKMMERLGFTDGTSLEDKRLTKGIERAQRKVEERNFSTRKHLLDWDEPMDFQRKEFYTARQRILEERDLPGLIFDTIDRTIHTTVDEYLGGNFSQRCIAEWCRINIEVNVNEDEIDVDDMDSAKHSITAKAIDEAHDTIRTSIGEYIDSEEPPSKWDVGGLLHWSQRLFKVSMTQNQLRKMEPNDIEEALCRAADKHFRQVDLEPIAVFLDPLYPPRALAEWARTKFNVNAQMEDLTDGSRDEVTELLLDRVRSAYHEREVAYPVEWCIDQAFSVEGQSQDSGCPAATAELVAQWINSKYNVGWSAEQVQGRSRQELYDSLLQLSREYLNGRLEEEIDRRISETDQEAVIEWARERFGRAWNQRRFEQLDIVHPGRGDLRQALVAQGREWLRWELSRLEQFVLLRIYDQAWKDHLLEMDHLKHAIMQRPLGGDQTHPQSQYAIEGRDLFTQMWSRIAARVTDLIFKIQATSAEPAAARPAGDQRSALQLQHADSTGAGFAGAAADQRAAMRSQNVEAKVETIRRDRPKVGRNDPCPCGSGKKYKNCHGRG